MDTYLDGIDETSGQLELNLGNFGVLYRFSCLMWRRIPLSRLMRAAVITQERSW